jgi:hypothetical protein
MNKTLILVICDFLLLNLLALTRWEQVTPAVSPLEPPPVAGLQRAPAKAQNIVTLMQLTLQDEENRRNQVTAELQSTRAALQTNEQSAARLEDTLAEKEQAAQELQQLIAASKQRVEQLQHELETREAEAANHQTQIATLQQQQAEAAKKITSLTGAVASAEQEKQLLRETTDLLKSQVTTERDERQKVQQDNARLVAGLGELAARSDEIAKELHRASEVAVPANINTVFDGFLVNRVLAYIDVEQPGLFGPSRRESETSTVFVTDGKATYALLHVEETPFTLRKPVSAWSVLSVRFWKGTKNESARNVEFLAEDPHLVALPVDPAQVAALGLKARPLATNPFQFPDAIIISHDGTGYGKVPFKLDPESPGYVRMDNRLLQRLLGDFSPSTGDLVLSESGELLGMMINSDYCALVTNFQPAQIIPAELSANPGETSVALGDVINRIQQMPTRLQ